MKWKQTSADNTVNDLRYEIKFDNYVKEKIFIKWNIAFLSWTKIYFILGDIFFSDSKEFNYLSISFGEADTKRHRYALAKASDAALVKRTDWIIKNDRVIVWCFSVSDLNMAKQAILFDSPQHDF